MVGKRRAPTKMAEDSMVWNDICELSIARELSRAEE